MSKLSQKVLYYERLESEPRRKRVNITRDVWKIEKKTFLQKLFNK